MNTMSAEEIRKKVCEIIYPKSHDTSEGIIIKYENIYAVIDALTDLVSSQSSTPAGEDVEAMAEKIAKEWDIYWTESGEISCNSLEAIKAALQNKVPVVCYELLKEYEQWEADLISDNSMWWPYVDKDAISGKTYEKMLELQEKRNKLLYPIPQ